MKEYDLIIIGGGAAGINCAIFAKNSGIDNILLIEKENILGGALVNGDYNLSELSNFTGEVYREKKLNEYNALNVDTYLDTNVMYIEGNSVICTSEKRGIERISGKAIIIANGAREIGRNFIDMPGDRCSGIYTVGMAEKILNIDNITIGENVIIYGDCNIHKIYNKLNEKEVNIKAAICQKLNDEILGLTKELYLNYKVEEIIGDGRISKIIVSKDFDEEVLECDTLILAYNSIPDGSIAMKSGINLSNETLGINVDSKFMTSKDGIFACGNCINIHASMEELLEESRKVTESVRKYLK